MSRRNKNQQKSSSEDKNQAGEVKRDRSMPDNDQFRLFKKMWYVLLGLMVLVNIVDLFLMGNLTFGSEEFSPYSIMSSKAMFIGYNVWSILLAGANVYSLIKKQRILFLITLLLLIIIFLYPYFTGGGMLGGS